MENDKPETGRKVVLTPVKFGGSASPLMGNGCGDLCSQLPRTVKDPGMAQIHTQRLQNDIAARLQNKLNPNMAPGMAPSMKPSGP